MTTAQQLKPLTREEISGLWEGPGEMPDHLSHLTAVIANAEPAALRSMIGPEIQRQLTEVGDRIRNAPDPFKTDCDGLDITPISVLNGEVDFLVALQVRVYAYPEAYPTPSGPEHN